MTPRANGLRLLALGGATTVVAYELPWGLLPAVVVGAALVVLRGSAWYRPFTRLAWAVTLLATLLVLLGGSLTLGTSGGRIGTFGLWDMGEHASVLYFLAVPLAVALVLRGAHDDATRRLAYAAAALPWLAVASIFAGVASGVDFPEPVDRALSLLLLPAFVAPGVLAGVAAWRAARVPPSTPNSPTPLTAR